MGAGDWAILVTAIVGSGGFASLLTAWLKGRKEKTEAEAEAAKTKAQLKIAEAEADFAFDEKRRSDLLRENRELRDRNERLQAEVYQERLASQRAIAEVESMGFKIEEMSRRIRHLEEQNERQKQDFAAMFKDLVAQMLADRQGPPSTLDGYPAPDTERPQRDTPADPGAGQTWRLGGDEE